MTAAVVVVIGVVLVFFYNFQSLHNNFLVWSPSVFVRNLADLLDL